MQALHSGLSGQFFSEHHITRFSFQITLPFDTVSHSHSQREAPIRQIARNAGEDPSEVQLADGMRRHFGAMATFLGSEKARPV